MLSERLVQLLASAAALIVGIVFHESAHALVAYTLGDKTARSRGRVSLNPLAHIDPFGTVVLPLIMLALGGPVFAFAKPVPVYLGNLKHPKRDEVLVSAAGPLCNILLAVLACVVSYLTLPWLLETFETQSAQRVFDFVSIFVVVNLSLAFFNLIPLPPLDGSSILVPFLKGSALDTYYRIQHYSMPILIVVLYLVPQLTGIDLIGMYFDVTVYPFAHSLLTGALAGV